MTRPYYFLLALIISGGLSAQTITQANMPNIGDSVAIDIDPVMVAPGGSGMGQTWDFSSLTGSPGHFNFVDPANTPFSDYFPDANICGVSWENSYSYYNENADGMSNVGMGLFVAQPPPNDTALVLYTDPETVIEFPFEFNNAISDNFAGDDYALQTAFPFTGNLDITADGVGTLITPAGNFPNVIRYHLTSTKNGFGSVTTKDQYVWMSPAHRFWLMLTETTTVNGNPNELTWWATNPIGISTGVADNNSSELFRIQNTLVENGMLELICRTGATMDLNVYDLTGKLLMNRSGSTLTGRTTIDVNELNSGIYILQMNAENASHSERFVVR